MIGCRIRQIRLVNLLLLHAVGTRSAFSYGKRRSEVGGGLQCIAVRFTDFGLVSSGDARLTRRRPRVDLVVHEAWKCQLPISSMCLRKAFRAWIGMSWGCALQCGNASPMQHGRHLSVKANLLPSKGNGHSLLLLGPLCSLPGGV